MTASGSEASKLNTIARLERRTGRWGKHTSRGLAIRLRLMGWCRKDGQGQAVDSAHGKTLSAVAPGWRLLERVLVRGVDLHNLTLPPQ